MSQFDDSQVFYLTSSSDDGVTEGLFSSRPSSSREINAASTSGSVRNPTSSKVSFARDRPGWPTVGIRLKLRKDSASDQSDCCSKNSRVGNARPAPSQTNSSKKPAKDSRKHEQSPTNVLLPASHSEETDIYVLDSDSDFEIIPPSRSATRNIAPLAASTRDTEEQIEEWDSEHEIICYDRLPSPGANETVQHGRDIAEPPRATRSNLSDAAKKVKATRAFHSNDRRSPVCLEQLKKCQDLSLRSLRRSTSGRTHSVYSISSSSDTACRSPALYTDDEEENRQPMSTSTSSLSPILPAQIHKKSRLSLCRKQTSSGDREQMRLPSCTTLTKNEDLKLSRAVVVVPQLQIPFSVPLRSYSLNLCEGSGKPDASDGNHSISSEEFTSGEIELKRNKRFHKRKTKWGSSNHGDRSIASISSEDWGSDGEIKSRNGNESISSEDFTSGEIELKFNTTIHRTKSRKGDRVSCTSLADWAPDDSRKKVSKKKDHTGSISSEDWAPNEFPKKMSKKKHRTGSISSEDWVPDEFPKKMSKKKHRTGSISSEDLASDEFPKKISKKKDRTSSISSEDWASDDIHNSVKSKKKPLQKRKHHARLSPTLKTRNIDLVSDSDSDIIPRVASKRKCSRKAHGLIAPKRQRLESTSADSDLKLCTTSSSEKCDFLTLPGPELKLQGKEQISHPMDISRPSDEQVGHSRTDGRTEEVTSNAHKTQDDSRRNSADLVVLDAPVPPNQLGGSCKTGGSANSAHSICEVNEDVIERVEGAENSDNAKQPTDVQPMAGDEIPTCSNVVGGVQLDEMYTLNAEICDSLLQDDWQMDDEQPVVEVISREEYDTQQHERTDETLLIPEQAVSGRILPPAADKPSSEAGTEPGNPVEANATEHIQEPILTVDKPLFQTDLNQNGTNQVTEADKDRYPTPPLSVLSDTMEYSQCFPPSDDEVILLSDEEDDDVFGALTQSVIKVEPEDELLSEEDWNADVIKDIDMACQSHYDDLEQTMFAEGDDDLVKIYDDFEVTQKTSVTQTKDPSQNLGKVCDEERNVDAVEITEDVLPDVAVKSCTESSCNEWDKHEEESEIAEKRSLISGESDEDPLPPTSGHSLALKGLVSYVSSSDFTDIHDLEWEEDVEEPISSKVPTNKQSEGMRNELASTSRTITSTTVKEAEHIIGSDNTFQNVTKKLQQNEQKDLSCASSKPSTTRSKTVKKAPIFGPSKHLTIACDEPAKKIFKPDRSLQKRKEESSFLTLDHVDKRVDSAKSSSDVTSGKDSSFELTELPKGMFYGKKSPPAWKSVQQSKQAEVSALFSDKWHKVGHRVSRHKPHSPIGLSQSIASAMSDMKKRTNQAQKPNTEVEVPQDVLKECHSEATSHKNSLFIGDSFTGKSSKRLAHTKHPPKIKSSGSNLTSVTTSIGKDKRADLRTVDKNLEVKNVAQSLKSALGKVNTDTWKKAFDSVKGKLGTKVGANTSTNIGVQEHSVKSPERQDAKKASEKYSDEALDAVVEKLKSRQRWHSESSKQSKPLRVIGLLRTQPRRDSTGSIEDSADNTEASTITKQEKAPIADFEPQKYGVPGISLDRPNGDRSVVQKLDKDVESLGRKQPKNSRDLRKSRRDSTGSTENLDKPGKSNVLSKKSEKLKANNERNLSDGKEKSKSYDVRKDQIKRDRRDSTGSIKSSKSGSIGSAKSGSVESAKSGSIKSAKSGSIKSSKSGNIENSKSGSIESSKSGSIESSKSISIERSRRSSSRIRQVPDIQSKIVSGDDRQTSRDVDRSEASRRIHQQRRSRKDSTESSTSNKDTASCIKKQSGRPSTFSNQDSVKASKTSHLEPNMRKDAETSSEAPKFRKSERNLPNLSAEHTIKESRAGISTRASSEASKEEKRSWSDKGSNAKNKKMDLKENPSDKGADGEKTKAYSSKESDENSLKTSAKLKNKNENNREPSKGQIERSDSGRGRPPANMRPNAFRNVTNNQAAAGKTGLENRTKQAGDIYSLLKLKSPPHGKVPDVEPSRQRVQSEQRKAARKHDWSVDGLIQKILLWSPNWYSEYEKVRQTPPVTDKDMLLPLLETYDSYEDYIQIMTSHFLLECWFHVYNGWKQRVSQKTFARHSLYPVHLNLNITEGFAAQKQDRVFMDLACQGVFPPAEMSRGMPVMEGDLLKLDLKYRDQANQQQVKVVCGYVQRSFRLGKGNHNIHKVIAEKVKKCAGGSVVVHIEIRLLFRKMRICDSEYFEVSVLDNITHDIRQYSALVFLPKSLLARDILQPSNVNVFVGPPVMDDPDLLKRYNDSQASVINTISAGILQTYGQPKIYLLQGPPGTGKSHVITGLIERVIKQGVKCQPPPRILLCAPSNAAVDELARRLKKLCYNMQKYDQKVLNFVRFGKQTAIHRDVSEFSLDALFSRQWKKYYSNNRLELSSVRNALAQIDAKLKGFYAARDNLKKAGKTSEMNHLESEIEKLEKRKSCIGGQTDKRQLSASEENQIKRKILLAAQIICCTLNSSGSAQLMNFLGPQPGEKPTSLFTCVIIDEAAQCIEADTLIPLQYGLSKLVLVGDPEQLPPTVISKEAQDMNYGQSLFERYYSFFKMRPDNPIMMLTTQYRMHEDICHFPNNHVYMSKLRTDREIGRERKKNYPLKHYALFDICYGQEHRQDNGALCNGAEAKFVARLCEFILKKHRHLPPERIGIITPYQKQKSVIMADIQVNNQSSMIEVGTVDGFQGREKDVIIMSCVRACSATGGIGFMTDRRRMNVALTRAKYACYVVGHMHTLKTDKNWNGLVEDATSRRVLVKIRKPAEDNKAFDWLRK